jgi:hypothetical protein
MSNREAFDELVEALKARDALMAPGPLVELGATLAEAIDMGTDAVFCPKCKTAVIGSQNAGLVKQYRELVERLAADDSRDDDADIWEQFQNAGRRA